MRSQHCIHARHYISGEPIEIVCAHGVIESLRPSAEKVGAWVAPAFFDLQINGAGGAGFVDPNLSVESVLQIVQRCLHHGITRLCPTLITSSFEALQHGMRTIATAVACEPRAAQTIPAIHLEGPYIAPEDGPRGAHPRQHVRPPSWEEFCRLQEAAQGMIRLVTLAPETAGALPFIERLVRSGLVVALGHTAATGSVIRAAIAAGARLSTHLGNGCAAVLPRHDNPIWEQLAADELWASIISDGQHIPTTLLRCFLRVKTPARLLLTCDASSLAGSPPGRYNEWGTELEVLPEGRINVAGTPYLAGSWAFTDTCVRTLLQHTEVSLRDALEMASVRPCELLRLPVQRLEVGQRADLILFEYGEGQPFQLSAVVLAGESVSRS